MSESPGSSGCLQDNVRKSSDTIGAVRPAGSEGPPPLLAGFSETKSYDQLKDKLQYFYSSSYYVSK